MKGYTVNRPLALFVLGLIAAAISVVKLAPDLDPSVLVALVGVITALLPQVVSKDPKDPPGGTGSGDGKPTLTLIAGGALLVLASILTGCEIFLTPYGDELDACVTNAQTKESSIACRCAVNRRYGRPCSPEPAEAGRDADLNDASDATTDAAPIDASDTGAE